MFQDDQINFLISLQTLCRLIKKKRSEMSVQKLLESFGQKFPCLKSKFARRPPMDPNQLCCHYIDSVYEITK